MKISLRPLFIGAVASLLALVIVGCSPEAKKVRYMEQADRYFADGKYDEAEIDYKNALKLDGRNAHAVGQLGIIYYEQGNVTRALTFLTGAESIKPDNPDVRLRIGFILLASGKFDQARQHAEFVLTQRPQDPEAPILLADTATTAKTVESVRAYLQKLPAPAPDGAPVLTALGLLEVRQRRFKEGEAFFTRAVAKDPKCVPAHAALALLYRVQNDMARAESEYALAADNSPIRSPYRLQYARFKSQNGEIPKARAILENITQKAPDYIAAWQLLAEISATDRKFDDATRYLAKITARDSGNPEALLLSGRVKLALGQVDKSLVDLERMTKSFPKSPQAFYQLSISQIAAGQSDKAMVSLTQALNLSPNYPDALLLQAGMNLRKGESAVAVASLKQLVTQHPEMLQAWFMLTEGMTKLGNFDDALAVLADMDKRFPKNSQVAFFTGNLLMLEKKYPEARAAFVKAQEFSPDFLPAEEQLFNLDVGEKKYADAQKRAEVLLKKDPSKVAPYILLSKVHNAQGDNQQAEVDLKKAIELHPEATEAYYLLAGLYQNGNQRDKALANLEAIVAQSPKDTRALMLVAVMSEQKNDEVKAKDAYEKLLAVEPKFAPALNNLAYLYAEHFHDYDKALDAAQKARDLLPNEPHVADTLGWILFQKKQYPRAVVLLQESAAKLPDSPEIQFHYGMAAYMMADAVASKKAFDRALELNPKFIGNEAARQRLAMISSDASTAGAATGAVLEKQLVDYPDDPFVLTRLAAIYERENSPDKAIKAYETAAKANPKNTAATLGLIRLYAARGDTAKAMEMAKTARKVSPDNADLARAVGHLALQAGEYSYAASLLQEAASKNPDDASLQFDLGEAAYATGRLSTADAATKTALEGTLSPAQITAANRFLELRAIADSPSADKSARVDSVLATEPNNVAALMARAALDEQKRDFAAAQKNYEKAVARYPDFTPAKRGLVIAYARTGANDTLAYETGLKAREAYPDDAQVAKAFGIVLYRRNDFTRAANMLTESSTTLTDDAEVMFYLGMSQSHLKNPAGAKQSLQRALDLNLKPELATDARKVMKDLK
ncbi:MAG: repeat-containing protein [Verrucomicrobia bacterium]|nr:repeat-containing protein [Verrucomicrobiota bacterium]